MMSLIKRSYKYRMYPNKTQEELLAKTFGCVRVVWNACVDSFNSYDKETNPNPKFPTKSDLVIESDGLRLLSIVEFQTTLVLSPVPFQRTVLVNISYQFL